MKVINLVNLNDRAALRSAIAGLTSFVISLSGAQAATDQWNNFTAGPNLWSVGTNWLDGTVPPTGDPTVDLVFPASGADVYVSNNDLTGAVVNDLLLNSSSLNTQTLTGNSLE